mmetsp:Transcript_21490/g.29721  ORF Transcript_21490/g.29721 Transcript_21490/m.29721 type:complete len:147 (+) Transcript_21490:577-1017(+)
MITVLSVQPENCQNIIPIAAMEPAKKIEEIINNLAFQRYSESSSAFAYSSHFSFHKYAASNNITCSNMTKKKPSIRANQAYPFRLKTALLANQNPIIKQKNIANFTGQNKSKNLVYSEVPNICNANIITIANDTRRTAPSPRHESS